MTHSSGLAAGSQNLEVLPVAVADKDLDTPLCVIALHAADAHLARAANTLKRCRELGARLLHQTVEGWVEPRQH